MQIAFFDTKPYDKLYFEPYGQQQGVAFKFFDTRLDADTARLAAGCQGVCVFVNDTLDPAVIDQLAGMGVGLAALRCAGFNQVDLGYAAGKLRVVRVPAYSPYAVAEHTMALLLACVRRIHKAYNRTKEFNFSLAGLTGFDLHGKTVGVVGTGKIGRVFAGICRGFGMQVLAYDKMPDESLQADGTLQYVGLDQLLAQSDILSLHCPLTENTYHLLNSQSLARCKTGVVVLNTSRGALVDAEALLAAIKARQVGAACLDVYEEEGDVFFEDNSGHILSDDVLARLLSMPNVIVTSHQAFLTQEALENIAKTTVDNILQWQTCGQCDNQLC